MKYKGYIGHVTYDEEAKIFHGEVIGLKDVITFQGTSVKELEKAFHDSIDDYLDFCKQLKKEPEKPFSGKVLLRIPPKIHEQAALKAEEAGISLNTWFKEGISSLLSENNPT